MACVTATHFVLPNTKSEFSTCLIKEVTVKKKCVQISTYLKKPEGIHKFFFVVEGFPYSFFILSWCLVLFAVHLTHTHTLNKHRIFILLVFSRIRSKWCIRLICQSERKFMAENDSHACQERRKKEAKTIIIGISRCTSHVF